MGILNFFSNRIKITTSVSTTIKTQEELTNEYKSILKQKPNIKLNRKSYGISPEEILFLEYINEKETNISSLSLKFSYEYGLNYDDTISFLINNNFIRIGTAEESLGLYKVQDLKVYLGKMGLSQSGNKDTLIKRIIDNCNDFEDQFNQRIFKLTPEGEHIIDKYKSDQHIPKTERDKRNFDFMECGNNVRKHLQEGNLGLYACDLYNMSEVHRKEQHYNDQMECLILSAYMHLTGFSTLESYNLAVKDNFKYIKPHASLPPAVLRSTIAAMQQLNMDFDDYRDRFYSLRDEHIPIHILNENDFLHVMQLYLSGNEKEAQTEIKKYIDNYMHNQI